MTRARRRPTARALLAGAVVFPLLTACAFGPPTEEEAGSPPRFPTPSASATTGAGGGDDDQAATVLARGLDAPWGMAFLPDGGALVTERDSARILKVGPESDRTGLRVRALADLSDAVEPGGEGGLLGIAVSPEFADDDTVFVYYTTPSDNRIGRLTLAGTEATPTPGDLPKLAPEPIVTGIPRDGFHSGGRLAFGPDGFLYAGTGGDGEAARDPKNLGGAILRITRDGAPAEGNPDPASPVWSRGHRNVQGLAWDAGKRMYATEYGQDGTDELNVIEPGKDYGWPAVQGTPPSPDPKYRDPLVTWPADEASCSGLAVVETTLVTACLRGQRLWLVETTEQGTVFGRPSEVLTGQFGRLRTVVAAPDGSLWVSTSNTDGRGKPAADDDRILRLVFPGGGAGKS
ncbi:glucose/arabinose dehydrogenase [Catenuloplanes atrovinosus]|uniref:Glucose/arabinose dehydrogenase n=1 Tax=Catenuloplanes atrovinosus TaxID=137266 RepID=A0AAE3YWS0_9ACTN|nr:glucose/arabinose dehydrogenase [Catenuloplanes atrovinosus]